MIYQYKQPWNRCAFFSLVLHTPVMSNAGGAPPFPLRVSLFAHMWAAQPPKLNFSRKPKGCIYVRHD